MFTFFDTYEKIGEERGEKRGILIGVNNERTARITLMLDKGKTPEEIADFCGYTLDEIKDVKNKIDTIKS